MLINDVDTKKWIFLIAISNEWCHRWCHFLLRKLALQSRKLEKNHQKNKENHTHTHTHTETHTLCLAADLLILMKASRPFWPSRLPSLLVSFQQAITGVSVNPSIHLCYTQTHTHTVAQNNDRWRIIQPGYYRHLHIYSLPFSHCSRFAVYCRLEG